MKAKFKTSLSELGKNKYHVVMGVSIDQGYQNGELFQLFADLVNENESWINQLTLVPTGDLRRFYFEISENLLCHDAERRAREYSAEWVVSNQEAIQSIRVPMQIIHWEYFRVKPSFQKSYLRTCNEYETNPEFKIIADNVIKKFAWKFFNEVKEKNVETTIEVCIEATKKYCFEEASVFVEFIDLGANVQVYPGKWNQVMAYIYKKYTKNDPMPWIQYRFREK